MLTDSTSKTNIPMLRKPFSGVLPPGVPVVQSNNVGGSSVVDGETGFKLLLVKDRVIQEIPADFNLGCDEDGTIRCIYIKNGRIVQSNPIEQIQISPVGTGTVNVAKVTMPDGSSFFIKAPEGGGSSVGAISGGAGNMPLFTPVWLDYISSDPKCVPAMEYSITDGSITTPIKYAGKYLIAKYIDKGSNAANYNYQCVFCNPLNGTANVDGTGNVVYNGVVDGRYSFTVKKAGKYTVTSVSGRTSHHATSMYLGITPNGGDTIVHYTPCGQKAAFTSTAVYDLPENSTIDVSGSSSGGWANCTVRYSAPTDVVLYTKSGDEYIKATTFNDDGSLVDGTIYYTNGGASVSGKAYAYEEVFKHLKKDYDLAIADGLRSDIYTLSNGTTKEIKYYLAPDGHKITTTGYLSALNAIIADDSIGEAWYYVIDTTNNAECFYLPRTRHGFHGDKGYAKIGGGHTRMYLHFMVA